MDDMETGMDDRETGIDHRILAAFRARAADPRVATAARALSGAGEHGALWITAGLAAATVDGARRDAWLRATALTAGAHLASMVVKRIVRRPRPPHVEPLVRTAGRHPSRVRTPPRPRPPPSPTAPWARTPCPRSPPPCASHAWSSACTIPPTWPREPPWGR